MKLRQMCGGGTYRRDHLRPRRTDDGAVISDYVGWGLFPAGVDAGPFTVRSNRRLREHLTERALMLFERTRLVEGLLAEAWERGAYEMGEFVATNPGPSGIPFDPPSNPFRR